MSDVHTLAGAYALDAVDDIERAAFRRHLAECESCALEVAELSETATRLTGEADVPAGLRDRVLAQVAETAQVGAAAPYRASGQASVRVGSIARTGRWRRLAAVAAAAGVLAGGAGAVVYFVQEQRIDDRVAQEQARAEQIEAVLTAPDAAVNQAEAALGSGTVTVVDSQARDAAVVALALPDLDPDEAYELWLGTGSELVSAGVLEPGVGSTTALVTDLGGADLVGVSREPAAGSPTGQPTTVVATVPVAG